jgi:hypothetical protein
MGRRDRGQALVEFALISLVLYLLIAATIEFGRLIFSAQALQDAARVTAREVALTPLTPEEPNLQAALADPLVTSRVFDPQFLFVDLGNPVTVDPDTFFASKPIVNQMLRPLMIYEQLTAASDGLIHNTLHYPGTLVMPTGGGPPTVLIPLVTTQADPGAGPPLSPFTEVPATLGAQWVPVVEEVVPASGTSSFPASQGGMVALRINYLFQSAMLAGYQPAANVGDINANNPIVEDGDPFMASLNALGFTYYKAPDAAAGPYAGQTGLGRAFAQIHTVRPFRKVMSAQAVFRREILFK